MGHSKEDDRNAYVLKAGEENRRYAQELLRENERLRLRVGALENERLGLVEKVQLTSHLLEEHEAMRSVLGSLQDDRRQLQEQLLGAREQLARQQRESADVQRRLGEIEAQNRRFAEEYVEVETRNNNLMNLYVASYRLHGTVQRQEVLATIQEIVANLVGCEEHAIFETGPEPGVLQLVASVGIDADVLRRVNVGEGPIGRTAAAGRVYVAEPGTPAAAEEGGLTACIPLALDGRLTGAIALFRLLPQKTSLAPVDHELFELLATHAATALYCTRLHALREEAR
jgi:GAF domain